MGRMVAVEGLDGAGKRTLVDTLTARLRGAGGSVARMAFPRYENSVHAQLARDALYGELGDLTGSVYGMAVLFALDRRDAIGELVAARDTHDLLLVDRYLASNAAYGAARLGQDTTGAFVDWVRALEIDRFGVPVPDTQVLLRVPAGLATERALGRAATDTARRPDRFETDDGLQARCARRYDELAAAGWVSPWVVLDGTRPADTGALVRTLLGG